MPYKLSRNDVSEIALDRGYLLLCEYLGTQAAVSLVCKVCGYIWSTRASHFLRGSGCPNCAGQASPAHQLKRLRTIARNNGGRLLSNIFHGARENHRFECAEGHQWSASASNVWKKNGTWCPTCAGRKKNLKEFINIIRAKGGTCHSDKYESMTSYLDVVCADGHRFQITPASLKRGSWCKQCFPYLMESFCRLVLEYHLGFSLPTKYPSWLVSDYGGRMQLDGYDELNKFAFEYQGEQHYQNIEAFGDETDLKRRKSLDLQKQIICKNNNVVLLEIPFISYLKQCRDIEVHIVELLKKTLPGYKQSKPFGVIRRADVPVPSKLQNLKRIAEEKGGECLSTVYLGVDGYVELRCANGHEWETRASNVFKGHWCRTCAGLDKYYLEDIRKLVENNGGTLISDKYSGAHEKLLVSCDKGHVFKSTASKMLRGIWCPECGKVKCVESRKIKRHKTLKGLAKKFGGELLTPKCLGFTAAHEWKCKEGHRFFRSPRQIKRAGFCPVCANWEEYSKLQTYAESFGGELVSPLVDYRGHRQPLLWRCINQHEFEKTPKTMLGRTVYFCEHCKKT